MLMHIGGVSREIVWVIEWQGLGKSRLPVSVVQKVLVVQKASRCRFAKYQLPIENWRPLLLLLLLLLLHLNLEYLLLKNWWKFPATRRESGAAIVQFIFTSVSQLPLQPTCKQIVHLYLQSCKFCTQSQFGYVHIYGSGQKIYKLHFKDD